LESSTKEKWQQLGRSWCKVACRSRWETQRLLHCRNLLQDAAWAFNRLVTGSRKALALILELPVSAKSSSLTTNTRRGTL
jgi:hypothetical protein